MSIPELVAATLPIALAVPVIATATRFPRVQMRILTIAFAGFALWAGLLFLSLIYGDPVYGDFEIRNDSSGLIIAAAGTDKISLSSGAREDIAIVHGTVEISAPRNQASIEFEFGDRQSPSLIALTIRDAHDPTGGD